MRIDTKGLEHSAHALMHERMGTAPTGEQRWLGSTPLGVAVTVTLSWTVREHMAHVGVLVQTTRSLKEPEWGVQGHKSFTFESHDQLVRHAASTYMALMLAIDAESRLAAPLLPANGT